MDNNDHERFWDDEREQFHVEIEYYNHIQNKWEWDLVRSFDEIEYAMEEVDQAIKSGIDGSIRITRGPEVYYEWNYKGEPL